MDFEIEVTSERFDPLDDRWLGQVSLLTADLRREGGMVTRRSTPQAGQKGDVGSLVLALGSGGVFTAVIEAIKAFVSRDDGRVGRPSWRLLLGLSLGLAAPLTVERGSMSFRWAPETWFFADRAIGFAVVAVLLGAAAVGMCAAALQRDGAFDAQGWAPVPLVRAGVLFAVLWGAGSAVPAYDQYAYTRSYFDVIGANRVPVTVTMILLVLVLAAAVPVGGRRMSTDAGKGVVAGAALFLVALEIIEVATQFGPDESRQGSAFLWMFVPAMAYVGTIVRMLRHAGPERGEVS